MIYVHWLVPAIYALLCIATMIAVLLDRKEPVKTLAWLLVLIFLPLVGIILYFFFGQNTRKQKLISRKSVSMLTKRSMLEFVAQQELVIPIRHKEIVNLFINQNMALPFGNNNVQIFTQGKDMFDSLIEDISKATSHIHLETYIFQDDQLGHIVADALIRKAREGVEVRVLYDDVGSWKSKRGFFENMRNEGIDVKSFLPVLFPLFTSKMNYRNHRKICTIDGKVGYIGGMNIADRYVNGTNEQPWRDTHLRIEGGAVYGLQRTFLMDWFFMDRTLLTDKKYYPSISAVSGGSIVQIVTSSSVTPWPDIMQGYVRVLNNAKRYVYMETPYFMPTMPILFAIQTAALAGVDVRIVIPKKGDSFLVDCASRSFFNEALKAGAKIYLYKEGFNHSKILVCDDEICSVGSTNIDSRSFENNMEVNAFIYDTGISEKIAEVVLADIENSELLTLEANRKKNIIVRLWDSVIRLMSPLL